MPPADEDCLICPYCAEAIEEGEPTVLMNGRDTFDGVRHEHCSIGCFVLNHLQVA